VVDTERNQVLYEKNSTTPLPIASVTKLMTAMVVLDARLPLFEEVAISDEDVDRLKGSRSRLPVGARLTRYEALHLALVASDNRAASALARHYPGGKAGFIAAMNRKSRSLAMFDTHFDDPTGLVPSNTSTARDLLRMARAAYGYPVVRSITTTPSYSLTLPDSGVSLEFNNTNRLLRTEEWAIGLSKTGYIHEAGRCLVMQADVAERPLLIVLLHGDGRGVHFADAVRIRQWLQRNPSTA
jgi:D-alanyl-D-alanine endopeptidase (penicillin-binding protein 7)